MGIIGEIMAGALVLMPLILGIATIVQGEDYDNYGAQKRDYLGEGLMLIWVVICVGLVLLRLGL